MQHFGSSEFDEEDLLDSIQQGGISDFCPQAAADGWTYFYVPDGRSVYRVQAGGSAPELVCGDCDGNAQVSGGKLYFFRKGTSALRAQWISADLDGGNQQVLSSNLISASEDWDRTVVGDFLVIEGDQSITFAPLAGGDAQPLTIAGEQVAELLWTDGDVLYYATQRGDSGNVNIWKYDFQGEPERLDVPDTYRYGNHAGNQVFFLESGQSDVYALTLPRENWERLGSGNVPVYPVGDGDYLFLAADQVKTFDAAQLMGDRTVLQKSGGTFCGLAVIDDSLIVCCNTEYHSNYAACGCGATYIHYYVRTSLVNRVTGAVLWTSHGDDYRLDT
jgi:hypothetical protein